MMLNSIKTNLKIIYTESGKTPKTMVENIYKKQSCNSQEFN